MVRNRKIKIFSILCALIYIYYSVKSSNNSRLSNNLKEKNLWSASDEWLQIHKHLFIRKQTAQYLLDRGELIIFMLAKNGTQCDNLNFLVTIYHKNRIISTLFLQAKATQFYEWNMYQDHFLKANFDLDSIMNTYNLNFETLEIKFYIKSSSIHINNQDVLINAKIKHYRDANKKHDHSIICAEPLYLDKSQFADFQWWVELARLSGYKKIAIYNNSIENSPLFNNFLQENQDFLDIHQFNFLPDLIRVNNTYVRNVNDLIIGPKDEIYWNFYQTFFLATDAMAYHECLFKYSDEFKYIIIQDNDELVIPNRLKPHNSYNDLIKAFEGNKIHELCEQRSGTSILDDYLASTKSKYGVPKNHSLYFQPVYYMNPVTVKDLIAMLVNYLAEAKKTGKKYPVSLDFVDQIHKNFVFVYTITGESEYDYVVEMVEFYKKVIEPYLDRNSDKLKLFVDNFNEIFYMTRDLTIPQSLGKSFSNADTAMVTNPHYPKDSYATVYDESHFLSHFRRRNNKLKNFKASITNIKMDLNYFICYYIPILDKLSSIKFERY